MSDLVHHDGKQIHSMLLALITEPQKLGAAARRRINEPAPAGGADRVAGGQSKCRAAQVFHLHIAATQRGGVHAGGFPAAESFGHDWFVLRNDQ